MEAHPLQQLAVLINRHRKLLSSRNGTDFDFRPFPFRDPWLCKPRVVSGAEFFQSPRVRHCQQHQMLRFKLAQAASQALRFPEFC